MKTIKWDERKGHLVIGNHPSKTGRNPTLDDVKIGNKIMAKYKGADCRLKVVDQIGDDSFKAEVLYLESSQYPLPSDIQQGDIVSIGRQHICTLFAD